MLREAMEKQVADAKELLAAGTAHSSGAAVPLVAVGEGLRKLANTQSGAGSTAFIC